MFEKKRKIRETSFNAIATEEFFKRRSLLVFCGFVLLFSAIIVRSFIILLFSPSSKNLEAIAHRQYEKNLALSEYRGTIYDRRQVPLAISIRKPSLFINPKIFAPTPKESYLISKYLGIKAGAIKKMIDKEKYFGWLKRKIPMESADRIMGLNIRGLFKVMEPDRYYPFGADMAPTLGYVGVDNRGLIGLERKLDKDLRGNSFNIFNTQDARGKPIFIKSDFAAPEKSGNNIYLTIDQAIQEIAQRELLVGVKNAKAKQGFVIVSDPHTGRILALANYPTFNPNERLGIKLEATQNHALLDTYEPGSVIKSVVLAGVLKRNLVTPNEEHFCENGVLRGDNWQIKDDHPFKTLDTTGVMVHSSNICTYKIAKRIGPEGLYQAIKEFGITTNDSLLDFPGQVTGYMERPEKWRQIRFANIAFGQGMTTTGLEMVTAYGAIANGGHLMKPYLIDRIESSDGLIIKSNASKIIRTVLTPDQSKTMRKMLQAVVDDGTGRSARLEGYTAGGKTGTSEKVDPLTKAYSPTKRTASFIGFTPIEDPHLVIYVVIDEPGNAPYYGALWAAPVFKSVGEKTLKYLNVAPDKVGAQQVTIAKGLLPNKAQM